MNHVHTIITYGPPWQNFLRRDREGRIADHGEARHANALWAAKNDRRLKRLVAARDAEGVCRRLKELGIQDVPARWLLGVAS
ncbi:hypothetical protein [Ensifer canadensis]